MNRIVLVGRLAQEPELRYTQTGIAVAKFAIAVNRPFLNQQGQREADFIDIVVWRNQAENCANYLSKGRLVGIDGRLQIRSYETADGQRRRVAEVVAERVEFLDRARDTGEGSDDTGRQQTETEDDSGFPDDVPF